VVHPAESKRLHDEPKSDISEKVSADLLAFGIRAIQRHNDFKILEGLFSDTFEGFL
jgi:hypothetical protein